MPISQPYPNLASDNRLERRVALAVSGLLHPAVVPSWAFACILLALPPGAMPEPIGLVLQTRLWMLGILCFFTLVLPVAGLTAAYYLGIIQDAQLRPGADRAFALWLTAGVYGGVTYMLLAFLPTAVFHIMVGLSGLALLQAVTNRFYRISGHGMAIAAFAGYWAATAARTAHPALVWPLVGTILATGLVAWARLTLGAHTNREIVWGIALGAVAGFGVGWW